MKKLSIIACMDNEGIIGVDNNIPWNVPADMAHFKKYTMNKPILMGSNTFFSLNKLLEGRTPHIVISKKEEETISYIRKLMSESTNLDIPEVILCQTLDDFFSSDLESLGDEVVCIGGGQMYKSILPYATNLIITKLNRSYRESDEKNYVYFPNIGDTWKVVNTQKLENVSNIHIGDILYLENTVTYNNVYSFSTGLPLEIEEVYCAKNQINIPFSLQYFE